MINCVFGDHLDDLKKSLFKKIETKDPFDAKTVIIPNLDLANQLKVDFALEHDVCMNINFRTVEQFLNDCLEIKKKKLISAQQFSVLIQDILNENNFPDHLKNYFKASSGLEKSLENKKNDFVNVYSNLFKSYAKEEIKLLNQAIKKKDSFHLSCQKWVYQNIERKLKNKPSYVLSYLDALNEIEQNNLIGVSHFCVYGFLYYPQEIIDFLTVMGKKCQINVYTLLVDESVCEAGHHQSIFGKNHCFEINKTIRSLVNLSTQVERPDKGFESGHHFKQLKKYIKSNDSSKCHQLDSSLNFYTSSTSREEIDLLIKAVVNYLEHNTSIYLNDIVFVIPDNQNLMYQTLLRQSLNQFNIPHFFYKENNNYSSLNEFISRLILLMTNRLDRNHLLKVVSHPLFVTSSDVDSQMWFYLFSTLNMFNDSTRDDSDLIIDNELYSLEHFLKRISLGFFLKDDHVGQENLFYSSDQQYKPYNSQQPIYDELSQINYYLRLISKIHKDVNEDEMTLSQWCDGFVDLLTQFVNFDHNSSRNDFDKFIKKLNRLSQDDINKEKKRFSEFVLLLSSIIEEERPSKTRDNGLLICSYHQLDNISSKIKVYLGVGDHLTSQIERFHPFDIRSELNVDCLDRYEMMVYSFVRSFFATSDSIFISFLEDDLGSISGFKDLIYSIVNLGIGVDVKEATHVAGIAKEDSSRDVSTRNAEYLEPTCNKYKQEEKEATCLIDKITLSTLKRYLNNPTDGWLRAKYHVYEMQENNAYESSFPIQLEPYQKNMIINDQFEQNVYAGHLDDVTMIHERCDHLESIGEAPTNYLLEATKKNIEVKYKKLQRVYKENDFLSHAKPHRYILGNHQEVTDCCLRAFQYKKNGCDITLTGQTGFVDPSWGAVRIIDAKSPRLSDYLSCYVDLTLLSSYGLLVGTEFYITVLSQTGINSKNTGNLSSGVLRGEILPAQQASKWLCRLIDELYKEDHAYVLPAETALNYYKSSDWRSLCEDVYYLKAQNNNFSILKFLPLNIVEQLSLPHNVDQVILNRYQHFFENFIVEK